METLGVDLRTRAKQLGAKEKEGTSANVRFSFARRNRKA